MVGARDLCERVLAGPAVPCCTDENDSGDAGNRWEEAKMAENGVVGVEGGTGCGETRRGGCIGWMSAKHANFDVLGGGLACMCLCMAGNASTMCGTGVSGRGNANKSLCSETLLCEDRMNGACCFLECTCAVVAVE